MEAANIGDSLDRLAAWLSDHDYGAVEVLVVVADSTDGTAQIAESKTRLFRELRVIHAGPRVGKGRDVRLGIFEAHGRYRMFMDADLATPLHHLDDVKAFMDRGGKVAIAVRDLLVIHKTFVRKLMSTLANIAARTLVVGGIKDTQCGFKVFEAKAAEQIFGRMTMLQWSFDMEVLAIAKKLGYKIELIEAPDWRDPKAAGAGLVGDSQIMVALKGFMDPFKIRWNIIAGKYRRPNYTHNRSIG